MEKESQSKKEETSSNVRDLLLLTHIYYDAGVRSLKDQAIAEIITKILFLSPNKRLKLSAIQKGIKDIIGVGIAENQVKAGLDLLQQANAVAQYSGEWLLKPNEVIRVQSDLQSAQQQSLEILNEYFPLPIDQEQLRKWFLSAGAAFFGRYDEMATRLLCREEPIRLSAKEILDEALRITICEYGLDEHGESLASGFKAFLDDYKKPSVYGQVWSFAQSMLAAKIVTASIGPDPITIRKFRGANIYLDTNVLFFASLEAHNLAPVFEAFTKSLNQIGATLHVIGPTLEEYNRAVKHKKDVLFRTFDNFPIDLLDRSGDDLWKTARGRGCQTKEDLVTFFEQIERPPIDSATETAIILEEDNDLMTAFYNGSKDRALLDNIANEWRNFHCWDKSWAVLAHDAALVTACNYLRNKGQNAWVVTADRSMQALAVRWAGKTGMPSWISLDVLVQIMAITGTGPARNPQNFAPLLAALIEAEVRPRDNAFTPDDLSVLLDYEEQIKELPIEDAERFAILVAQNRLSGRSNDAVVRDIRRALQGKKRDVSTDLRTLQERVSVAEQKHTKILGEQEQSRAVIISLLLQRRLLWLRTKATLWGVIGLIAAIVTWRFANELNSQGYTMWAGFLYFLVLPEIGGPFWRAISRFKEARSEAELWADKKAKHLSEPIK